MSRKRLIAIAATLALLYLGVCLLGKLTYRRLLYPAPIGRASASPPADASDLFAKTADGLDAHGWLFHAHAASDVLIVHFHGNGETIDDNVDDARALVSRGFDVLLVEYRGYGNSKGQPTEDGLYADAEALIDAVGLVLPTLRNGRAVVLWGTSLGSGVATEMAKRGHGSALILVAPFTSIPDVGQRIARVLPVSLIVSDAFDSRSKAAAISLPVLIIHGTSDEVVPYDMGETLSRTFPHARLISIEGGHHNDLFVTHGEMLLDAIAQHAAGEKR